MYILLSDFTDEKVDVYNSVELIDVFSSMEDAIASANEHWMNFNSKKNVHAVDTEGYDDVAGAEVNPYPIYVTGEAEDNGEDYHIYFMVSKIGG